MLALQSFQVTTSRFILRIQNEVRAMKKQTKTIRTKRAMLNFSVRVKPQDRKLWIDAATKAGESLSEILRIALREHCKTVLREDRAA
jgi:hypothetical protein